MLRSCTHSHTHTHVCMLCQCPSSRGHATPVACTQTKGRWSCRGTGEAWCVRVVGGFESVRTCWRRGLPASHTLPSLHAIARNIAGKGGLIAARAWSCPVLVDVFGIARRHPHGTVPACVFAAPACFPHRGQLRIVPPRLFQCRPDPCDRDDAAYRVPRRVGPVYWRARAVRQIEALRARVRLGRRRQQYRRGGPRSLATAQTVQHCRPRAGDVRFFGHSGAGVPSGEAARPGRTQVRQRRGLCVSRTHENGHLLFEMTVCARRVVLGFAFIAGGSSSACCGLCLLCCL